MGLSVSECVIFCTSVQRDVLCVWCVCGHVCERERGGTVVEEINLQIVRHAQSHICCISGASSANMSISKC